MLFVICRINTTTVFYLQKVEKICCALLLLNSAIAVVKYRSGEV
ncbi:hypothetical protein Pint_34184 [Pistacia integerrima]|uniref:Uncharacterized protein n=1 Tax=Pistacia integerrima TaxID=434235 RepID=A0ACC0X5M7_9ROSI|nr:hypothetical protein Pint_34184 [Pistacia integerrima]